MKQIFKKLAIILSVALVCAPLGAMAANKLIVNGTDGVTPQMVVTDQGYVGIGHAAPVAGLHVIGTTTQASQVLSAFSGTTTSSGGGGYIGYHNNASGAIPNAGDRLGYFLFGSFDGGTPRNSAGVTARAETSWIAGSSFPSYFTFETTALNATSRTERIRITSSGNVGIATTTPQQKLEVNGGVRIYPVLTNPNTDSATFATKPTCDASTRGTIWFTPSSTPPSPADVLEICVKTGPLTSDYSFKSISIAP